MKDLGNKRPVLGTLLAGLFLLAAQGCGGGSAPLLPVSGQVTYKGSPVPGGTIVFTPDAARGNHGGIALGKILEDGSYALRTGEEVGAAPGHYRVTVASFITAPAMPGQPFSMPQSFLPEHYRDPDLSLLSCEVQGNKANQFDFHLD